jgi:two-component system, OmpR family, response regulator MprA
MMVAATERNPKSRVAAPILVVDDEPDVLDVVVMMLESEGYEVRAAPDGVEALDILERDKPGVVLLDMRMPRMDGWAFARAARERNIEVPIIVMTAAQDARRWAEEIDAAAYLGKPFQLEELVETVRAVLGDGT